MLRTVLTLTLVLLAAAAYRVVWRTAPDPFPAQTASDTTSSTTLAVNPAALVSYDRELPTLAKLSVTVDRPLFVQARRPGDGDDDDTAPAVTAVELPAEPVDVPHLVLTAVFRTEGADLVLLRDLATGEAKTVRPGETISGWQVTGIEARRVLLAKDGVTHVVELRDGPGQAIDTRVPPQPSARLRRQQSAGIGDDAAQESLLDGSDEGEKRQ